MGGQAQNFISSPLIKKINTITATTNNNSIMILVVVVVVLVNIVAKQELFNPSKPPIIHNGFIIEIQTYS